MPNYRESIVYKDDIDPLWLAWLAGLIDGEGSFVLGLSVRKAGRRRNRNDRKFCIFSPIVVIKMHAREAEHLDHIQETLGFGKRYHIERQTPTAGESWQTTSVMDTIQLCNLILPYLKLKATQASALRDASQKILSWRSSGGYGKHPERAWELYQIRENLNPGTYRNPRRITLTREDIYKMLGHNL